MFMSGLMVKPFPTADMQRELNFALGMVASLAYSETRDNAVERFLVAIRF